MKKNDLVRAGILALMLLSPGPGRCAGPGVSDSTAAAGADTVMIEKGHWVGFPVAFYTPETGFGGGAALGYIYPRLGRRHPSSLMGIGFYTEKNQTVIALAPELYLAGGFHGLMEVAYQKFPDSYWGIGSDTRSGDEERYTSELIDTRLLGEIEVYPGLRLGVQYRYRREVMLEREEGGELERRTITGSSGGTTAGIGVLGSYDSRDNRFSSSEGWYLFCSYTSYGSALLSDFTFNSLMIDARRFIPVFGSHVIAARLYARSVSGRAPFQELPYLGGANSMRGYQAGRYRDDFAAFAQAEYRMPVAWVISAAVFGSAGKVSPGIGDLSFGGIRYTGGGGLRFRLNDQKFSIRIDYAVTGEGGSNFYIAANEAF